MNVLVTGGAGFIGQWLVERLAGSGHTVTVVDSLSVQIHGAIPQMDQAWFNSLSNVEFVRGDIRDQALMDSLLERVESVVHLAAETGTGQSMYQIARYNEVNQQATASLFEAIATKHRHIRRVLLASSRSVYGEGAYRCNGCLMTPQSRDARQMQLGRFEPTGPNGEELTLAPTPEEIPLSPSSIYAATKQANEVMGRIVAESYGLRVIALRFQNVYGERQSLRNPYTGILSIFSNRMRQNLPINIFEDGRESRDFIHVADVVRAIEIALQSAGDGFTVANIGSGVATTVMEVAQLLRTLLDSRSELEVTGDFRAGDIRHCYADTRRAEELFGFKAEISLTEGLQRFCRWVQTQPILEDRSKQAQAELSQRNLGRVTQG